MASIVNWAAERRLLQTVILAASLVPIAAGLFGVFGGLTDPTSVVPGIESHVRHLSGLELAIGLGFAWCAWRIESRTNAFRLLAVLVFIGGITRLLGVTATGLPIAATLPLIMELGVTPLICLWQARIAEVPHDRM